MPGCVLSCNLVYLWTSVATLPQDALWCPMVRPMILSWRSLVSKEDVRAVRYQIPYDRRFCGGGTGAV